MTVSTGLTFIASQMGSLRKGVVRHAAAADLALGRGAIVCFEDGPPRCT